MDDESMLQAVDLIRRQARLIERTYTTLSRAVEMIDHLTNRVKEMEAELAEYQEKVMTMGAQLAHFLEAGESEAE